ncbi:exo-beta-N-acetylmuramidase NamZ domain-containing protein [Bdellovibrio sp. HCB-110]|uniref:exo-beta-N-acetylmuramidase NamZ family protein n=1 Tax=Bdellovibrio sp. HCB-110 TaxID=3391182 RepID=UPI0039B36826
MKLGVEVLLSNPKMLKSLKGKRVGLVCHPASVDENLQHSLDLLSKKIKLSCAFGPQHGVRGDKQDNMIESPDFVDPVHKIPIFSLYGEVRRPTPEMMQHFDVLLFDLQDLGCRIYTFITTLLYVMEECAKLGKSVIVLDRPNPAGRPIEGFKMLPGWESFVGAAPIPMRHGLTVGELALYFKDFYKMNLDLQVVKMKGYSPEKGPGFGWDTKRPWVNPSPNAASLNMARAYSGTVLIEGTTLSEARGTTRALEIIGASDIDFTEVLVRMKKKAPQWHKGVTLRECFFEPTFHKHVGKLCHGFQFHTDANSYKHDQFKPFRLVALMLKVIREMHPKYPIYRDFAYEYVRDRLAFDVINGGPALKDWIENSKATPKDLDAALAKDEKSWAKERKKYLLY